MEDAQWGSASFCAQPGRPGPRVSWCGIDLVSVMALLTRAASVPELCVCACGARGLCGLWLGASPPPIAASSFPQAAPEQPCAGPHAGRHQHDKLLHRSGVPAGSLCPLEGIQLQSLVPGAAVLLPQLFRHSRQLPGTGSIGLLHGALSPVVG